MTIADEVRTKSLLICDEAGTARGSFRVHEGQPRLLLSDSEGRVRLSLSVNANGDSSVLLAGPDGSARIGMDYCDQPNGGPSLFLRDGAGNARLSIDFSDDSGATSISLADENDCDRLTLSLGLNGERAGIQLRDRAGQVRVEACSHDDDNSVRIITAEGQVETWITTGVITVISSGRMRVLQASPEEGSMPRPAP